MCLVSASIIFVALGQVKVNLPCGEGHEAGESMGTLSLLFEFHTPSATTKQRMEYRVRHTETIDKPQTSSDRTVMTNLAFSRYGWQKPKLFGR